MIGQKTGGRVKGTPNKNNADIKALARVHGAKALDTLIALMGSDDEDIRFKASNSLLDRGYGKAAQAVTGEGGEGPVRVEVVTGIARNQG